MGQVTLAFTPRTNHSWVYYRASSWGPGQFDCFTDPDLYFHRVWAWMEGSVSLPNNPFWWRGSLQASLGGVVLFEFPFQYSGAAGNSDVAGDVFFGLLPGLNSSKQTENSTYAILPEGYIGAVPFEFVGSYDQISLVPYPRVRATASHTRVQAMLSVASMSRW